MLILEILWDSCRWNSGFFIFTIDSVLKQHSWSKVTSHFWKWRIFNLWHLICTSCSGDAWGSRFEQECLSSFIPCWLCWCCFLYSQIASPSKKWPEKNPIQTKLPKYVWFLWISEGCDGGMEMSWIWLSCTEIVPSLPWWMTWPSIAQLYP